MSNELTYILGAGASYQSIPVVKTFPNRFKEFLADINKIYQEDSLKYFELFSSCSRFSKEITSHQSFDTYFKKLFHTNSLDLVDEFKQVLNLYFTWEHLEDDYETKWKKSNTMHGLRHRNELEFTKITKIDKRYDALIAGLLKPVIGKSEVFCKTNFITWNYDLNLFFSLKNYFAPEKTTKDFLNSISNNEYEWNIDNQISVINMNGYFYSSKFDDLTSLNEKEGISVMKEILENGFFEASTGKDANKIKFAWETEIEHAKVAKEKIAASENIVVIGYTFPLYNRLVDFEYLSHNDFGTHKKIVIQDPNSIAIRQNLFDLFEINDNEYIQKNVVALLDCDSFYVPSNIYGINRNNAPNVW
ncbi:MAG: hypothetical protein H7Z76_06820 [Methylotenera sp.]|nr:hypothetical protein [Flavobacterium sp.]